uniref:Tetraspanin 5a n=1 Tax=Oncorhynchus tshawytscha TaxID=74940 RepID=A0A8C8K620_ONCTS
MYRHGINEIINEGLALCIIWKIMQLCGREERGEGWKLGTSETVTFFASRKHDSLERRYPRRCSQRVSPRIAPTETNIFLLLGVAFLGIGLWAWNEKGVLSNISSITDLGGFDPVWLFLVTGGVMFILGFAGCIGALRENTFLLKFFSVFLGIIFFLELTAGVLAFTFKDWIKDQLNFFINNNIRAYRDDIDLQNLIDFTQEYWDCCGAFGADDWNLNIYFNCTDTNPSREKCGVPFSCCTKDPAEDVINTQCGYDVRAKTDVEQKTYIHVKGCVPQFEKWLQDNLTLVAGIFIGVALLQIFGICLAQNLVSDIEAVRASCLFT